MVALGTERGSLILKIVCMSFIHTDATTELHVSHSRVHELETAYSTQKSEV